MVKIELNDTQQSRAKQLKNDLDSGRVTAPQDTEQVNPWEPTSWEHMNSQRDYDVYDPDGLTTTTKTINPDKIAGVVEATTNSVPERLVKSRLHKILDWLVNGEYDLEHSDPPVYVEFDGEYYVTSDGINRSIACKAVGVDEITAEVTVI